jgi:hypothetical protein
MHKRHLRRCAAHAEAYTPSASNHRWFCGSQRRYGRGSNSAKPSKPPTGLTHEC